MSTDQTVSTHHTDPLDPTPTLPLLTSASSAEPAVVVPDFERLYAAESDPWQVHSSFYEQRKLEIVLACLGRPFYRSAWDPACGVGELALRLSERCTTVLATDLAASSVRLTNQRCAGQRCVGGATITVSQLTLPEVPRPPHDFDLVVLSEFLYYLDADDRAAALEVVDASTSGEAEIVAVHWRHHPYDAWISGAKTEAEIAQFLTARGWLHTVRHHDEDFVLDCFRKVMDCFRGELAG